MQKLILGIFLFLFLIPASQSFSQLNDSTLSIALPENRQSVYLDSDGFAKAVGLAENLNSLSSISNVQIQVRFFEEFNSEPVEIVLGSTILEVIPPNGISPYEISSKISNTNITKASVSLITFDSSPDKDLELIVYSSGITFDSTLNFSGVLQNGGAPISNATVYLAYYDDSFDPPPILGVTTLHLGELDLNTDISFEVNETINSFSKGFFLFADSDIFYSDFVDIKIPPQQSISKLVSISGVTVKDTDGIALSEIILGSTVNIESKTVIQFSKDQSTDETPYTYYIQIKESGKSPTVEYIGKYDGRFIGTEIQYQTIDWVPEKSGLFFIETFVWDRNNIPISEQGPFILIYVKE